MLSPHFYGINIYDPGYPEKSPAGKFQLPVDPSGWIAGLRLLDLSALRGGWQQTRGA